MIKTITDKVGFRIRKITSRKKKVYQLSFSQCGEDLLIDYVFKLRGIAQPSYIDIGANDPFYLNNTAIFYLRGCRGINIEANPKLIGTDARTLKAGDDLFGQRIYDTMKSTAPGTIATVDYKFPKPGTTEYLPKQSFVTRVGDQGCGVGYYK